MREEQSDGSAIESPTSGEAGKHDIHIEHAQGVVIGDYNIVYQTIVQRYPALKDYIYDFGETIANVTLWFVGRQFVFDAVDAFIATHPCGYFRIIADAGLGKTAIAAALVKRHDAPAHFNDARLGLTRPDQCLNDLCVQLIARYILPYDHLPERAGQNAAFLATLLGEARQKCALDQPLVLVIDALDEADPVPPGHNWLHLPDRLPEGVYFFLTQRPGSYPLTTAARTPVENLTVAWDNPHQQQDIAAHLRRQATERDEVRQALAAVTPPISVERFVAALQEASQGNFMYLEYVLADIGRHEPGFDPLRLEGLPRGLDGYYEQFWRRLEQVKGEGWNEWNELYRPAIGLLAVAQEPVPAAWLAAHLGRPAEQILERALQRWQPFLSREQRGGQETWRVVHRSFTDFLQERLQLDLPAMHSRVADRYLAAWGGLAAGLPRLLESDYLTLDNCYGLYLAAHLDGAGRTGDLQRLLELETTAQKNLWLKAWETGVALAGDSSIRAASLPGGANDSFLRDVERAWRTMEAANLGAVRAKKPAPCLSSEARYALYRSSIATSSTKVYRYHLEWAVREGALAPWQALDIIKHMTDAERQVEALLGIVPLLPPEFLPAALRLAIQAQGGESLAQALGGIPLDAGEDNGELERAPERSGMISYLSKPLLQEAFFAAQNISDDRARVAALVVLAPHVPEELFREALSAIGQCRDIDLRCEALARIAPLLPETMLPEMLAAMPRIQDPRLAGQVWEALAPRLAAELPLEMLAAAHQIADESDRAGVLVAVAPYLSEPLRRRVTGEVLSSIPDFKNARNAAQLLVDLAPWLSPAEYDEALSIGARIADGSAQAQVLTGLAPHLSRSQLERALDMVRGLEYGYVETLIALLPHLRPAHQQHVLHEALNRVGQDPNQLAKGIALVQLAPVLTEELLAEAWGIAGQLEDEAMRARTILGLAPQLSETQLAAGLAFMRQVNDEHARARFLALLLPYLPASLQAEALPEALTPPPPCAPQRQTVFSRHRWPAPAPPPVSLERLPYSEQNIVTAALRIVAEDTRAQVLAALVPHLHPAFLEQILSAVRQIGNVQHRVQALVTMLPYMESAREEMIGDVLLGACGMENENIRTQILERLSPYLPAAFQNQVLRAALSMMFQPENTAAGRPMAPSTDHTGPAIVLQEALTMVGQVDEEDLRALALIALGPFLPAASFREVLTITRQIADEGLRAWALRDLAPHVPATLLADFLSAARETTDGTLRARILGALASRLPAAAEQEDVLRECLTLISQIKSEYDRAEALVQVVPALAAGVLPEALALIAKMTKPYFRAWALGCLAPSLPQALQATALAIARQTSSAYSRVWALIALSSQWPERPAEIWREAVDTARQITNTSLRGTALVELLWQDLDAPLRDEILPAALAAARHEQGKWRAWTLAGIAEALPWPLKGKVWQEALDAAEQIADEEERADILAELRQHPPEEQRAAVPDQAATAVPAPGGAEWSRPARKALAALPDYLYLEAQLQEELAAIQRLGDEPQQVRLLLTIAPHLPQAQREDLLRATLPIALRTEEASARAEALTWLCPLLPDMLREVGLQAALVAASEIDKTDQADVWGNAVAGLLPQLSAPQRNQLLTEVLAADRMSGAVYESVLTSLAPHLPAELRPQVLDSVRREGDAVVRARALLILVPGLPEAEQGSIVREALAGLTGPGRAQSNFTPVDLLLAHGDRLEFSELVAASNQVLSQMMLPVPPVPIGPEGQGEILSRCMQSVAVIVPHLPPALQDEVLQEAVGRLAQIGEERTRLPALRGLVEHSAPRGLPIILAAARQLQEAECRAAALTLLVPHLPPGPREEVSGEALAAAREIEGPGGRASAVIALLPLLPTALRAELAAETLAAARQGDDFFGRPWVMVSLLPHLAPESRESVIETLAIAVQTPGALESPYERPALLARLVPFLSEPLLLKVLEALAQSPLFGEWSGGAIFIDTWSREVIPALISRLPEIQQQEVKDAIEGLVPVVFEYACRTDHQLVRNRDLPALVACLTAQTRAGPASIYGAWRSALRVCSARSRTEFLRDVESLIPLALSISGPQEAPAMLADMARSVQDVGRWWP